MSSAQPSWSSVESTLRPITLTPRRSNSGLIFAMYPSSVVQTGVKSFGCEKSTAQESPIQSWKLIGPSVVCASKSGAVSPICRAIGSSLVGSRGFVPNERLRCAFLPRERPAHGPRPRQADAVGELGGEVEVLARGHRAAVDHL